MASNIPSTLEQRQQLRAAAALSHRRLQRLSLGLLLLPIVLVLFYAACLRAPTYSAEARFSVRSGASGGAGAGVAGSLLATGAMGSSDGFVDGWAVSDFIASRDCMRLLQKKLDLRRYLSYRGSDPLRWLSPSANEDELYQAYRSSVDVSYNVLEQISVLKVRSFASKDSEAIATALIDVAQDFVNQMDDKGVAAAMDASRRALAQAERQDAEARDALTLWRVKNGNMDPAADAAMLQNLASQLETELNTAEINLQKIRTLDSQDHPMLGPAQAQVYALKRQLASTRQRLSGSGKTEASQLRSYETLKNTVDFAAQNLVAARQNHQQAYADTVRLRRYLSLIVQPIAETGSSNAGFWLLFAQALAAGLVLAMLGRFALSFRRVREP